MPSSPNLGGRSPKRQKSSVKLGESKMVSEPEDTVDVVEDGDAVIVLGGVAGVKKPIGLRVSSHILSMTSAVFKSLTPAMQPPTNGASNNTKYTKLVSLAGEDGDTMVLLCNILHLRNDALPPRLPAESLHKLAILADKYKCVVAVGRATILWFEELYTAKQLSETFSIIGTAYLLDEPTYFARFTERWILCEALDRKFVSLSADPTMRRLSVELHNRRSAIVSALRADLDILVDPCTIGFTDASKHFIDYAPGMKPEPDSQGRIGFICHNDREAGAEFLGALRESSIWPPTVWPNTIEAIVEAIKDFDAPDYDDCDKCEFCEDVKGKLDQILPVVKKMQAERLWGLCLDCFKAGGMFTGECRYEHTKPKT